MELRLIRPVVRFSNQLHAAHQVTVVMEVSVS